MPYGRVLVVDDMPVNLQVARGLLETYGLQIDSATSGQESINLIQAVDYDLVFMDHMMPEMDGVEAVRIIREWEREKGINSVPIVALTANALAGNMELFLSKGFNGFIPKPIDIARLNDVLNVWVRDKQSKETLDNAETIKIEQRKLQMANEESEDKRDSSSPMTIQGINITKGLAFCGGTEASYCAVLSTFCKDVEDRLPLLKTMVEADLPGFVIQVHSIKSAAAFIGADIVSGLAAELEDEGKAGNSAFVQEKCPVFLGKLTDLVTNIKPVLETQSAENQSVGEAGNTIPCFPLFKELEAALKSNNGNDISRILQMLTEAASQQQLDQISKDAIEQISDEVMMAEYDNARKIVEKLLEAKHGS